MEWERETALPEVAMEALRRPIGDIVAIVATVDLDGAPRTAAFGSVRPITPTRLRFGCNRAHDTFANVVRDGRVMVAVFADPDVAIGIRGRARVLREQIDSWPTDAVVEIEVESVKNDAHPMAPLTTGITYGLPAGLAERLERYVAEVEAATR
jgi:hypothetical protein